MGEIWQLPLGRDTGTALLRYSNPEQTDKACPCGFPAQALSLPGGAYAGAGCREAVQTFLGTWYPCIAPWGFSGVVHGGSEKIPGGMKPHLLQRAWCGGRGMTRGS